MARARPVAGLRPRATLLENARAIIAVRVAEMFSFADAIGDPARDEDLHNMRIAAKRLRYTLEMFRVCLGSDGPALIDRVKEIQDRIGVIHDADVLVEVVRLRLAVAGSYFCSLRHVAQESLACGERERANTVTAEACRVREESTKPSVISTPGSSAPSPTSLSGWRC